MTGIIIDPPEPCVHDTPGKANPVGHQEDSTGHQNGQGHLHGSTGWTNGQGHQKFHGECPEDTPVKVLNNPEPEPEPCTFDGPGNAAPVGHQEDSTGHLNGQGHLHGSTGWTNGQGHQKFHFECPPEKLIEDLSTGLLVENDDYHGEVDDDGEGLMLDLIA